MKYISLLCLTFILSASSLSLADSVSTKAQPKVVTVDQKNTVTTSSNDKGLTRITPKNKTTWTKIKDMFM